MVVHTVNKVAYRKHHFTTCCGMWNRIYNFLSVHGNNTTSYKSEMENITIISDSLCISAYRWTSIIGWGLYVLHRSILGILDWVYNEWEKCFKSGGVIGRHGKTILPVPLQTNVIRYLRTSRLPWFPQTLVAERDGGRIEPNEEQSLRSNLVTKVKQ